MNQKGFANIIVIIGVVIFVCVASYFIVNQQKYLSAPTKPSCIPEGGLNYENVYSARPIDQRLKCCAGLVPQEKPGIADAPAVCVKPTPTPTISPTPTPLPTSVPKPKNSTISVLSGQQFTLNKGQTARITDTGLEVEVVAFYNSPCPAGAQCIWSGVGIGFEYRFNGQVQKGIDLVQAFGYQTTIIKTDHENYANLVVKKLE